MAVATAMPVAWASTDQATAIIHTCLSARLPLHHLNHSLRPPSALPCLSAPAKPLLSRYQLHLRAPLSYPSSWLRTVRSGQVPTDPLPAVLTLPKGLRVLRRRL